MQLPYPENRLCFSNIYEQKIYDGEVINTLVKCHPWVETSFSFRSSKQLKKIARYFTEHVFFCSLLICIKLALMLADIRQIVIMSLCTVRLVEW